jgi:hypothetical protein
MEGPSSSEVFEKYPAGGHVEHYGKTCARNGVSRSFPGNAFAGLGSDAKASRYRRERLLATTFSLRSASVPLQSIPQATAPGPSSPLRFRRPVRPGCAKLPATFTFWRVFDARVAPCDNLQVPDSAAAGAGERVAQRAARRKWNTTADDWQRLATGQRPYRHPGFDCPCGVPLSITG